MGKRIAAAFILVSLITLSLVGVSPTRAFSRTITVPDDYSTITAALRYASSGDTVLVKKGVYEEKTLTIDKLILLIGEDANGTLINLHPPQVPETIFTATLMVYSPPIRIEADGVKLSGFTLISDGGMMAAYADSARIEGNVMISKTEGIVISMSVYAVGDANQIVGNSMGNLIVSGLDNVIAENSIAGSIEVTGSHNNVTANNVTGNFSGIILAGSFNTVDGNILMGGLNSGGIDLDGDLNTVVRNLINNSASIRISRGSNNYVYENSITNSRGGLRVIRGYNNTFYSNYIANNAYGVLFGGSQTDFSYGNGGPMASNNTAYHNNFINNTDQVKKTDYIIYGTNFYDNGKEGNYWSDYVGNDTNNDGIGDTPYIIDESRRDNFPLIFPFDVESNTIVVPSAETETAPTTALVTAAVAVLAIAGIGLAVYIRRHRFRLKAEKESNSI